LLLLDSWRVRWGATSWITPCTRRQPRSPSPIRSPVPAPTAPPLLLSTTTMHWAPLPNCTTASRPFLAAPPPAPRPMPPPPAPGRPPRPLSVSLATLRLPRGAHCPDQAARGGHPPKLYALIALHTPAPHTWPNLPPRPVAFRPARRPRAREQSSIVGRPPRLFTRAHVLILLPPTSRPGARHPRLRHRPSMALCRGPPRGQIPPVKGGARRCSSRWSP
jgi:hypothetical protein